MLLSIQAGYDARLPLSMDGDGTRFQEPLNLYVGKSALKTFESRGCIVEEAQPNYPIDAVWRAWLQLRAWQAGGALLAFYNDPAKRALMKPEAVFEVESGLKLSAFDITELGLNAMTCRTQSINFARTDSLRSRKIYDAQRRNDPHFVVSITPAKNAFLSYRTDYRGVRYAACHCLGH